MNIRGLFLINRRRLIATLIGAVLFSLASYFVVLPTPIPRTYFFPSYALLALFATLLGPVSGAFISLSGMVIVGIWKNNFYLSYTIASIVCGFIYGFSKNHVHAHRGKFGYSDIISFNMIQIAGNLVAWAVLAPVLELLLNPGRPAFEVFLQGLTAAFMDILSTEFIGTPILLVYAFIRKRYFIQPIKHKQ